MVCRQLLERVGAGRHAEGMGISGVTQFFTPAVCAGFVLIPKVKRWAASTGLPSLSRVYFVTVIDDLLLVKVHSTVLPTGMVKPAGS